jgi:hypothetical protein
MHYRARGLTIRTQNAARSIRQASRPLRTWIDANVSGASALDYGCGRLRYARLLARVSSRLGLVDSPEQLDRESQIAGRLTTVRTTARQAWPRCRVYTVAEFWGGIAERYDFVLCANVLSAIPSLALRNRSLAALKNSLSARGRLLVVNQHTNSYFTKAKASPLASDHLDGWILRSPSGPSYFGVLRRDKVIRILRRHHFRIRDSWIDGQSNYVLASK